MRARGLPTSAFTPRAHSVSPERSGLARFLVIVSASVGGSIACWSWVFFLMAFAVRGQGAEPARGALLQRICNYVVNPFPWGMGAWCGILLALPAVGCLWNRRLVPALCFVLAIGFVVATAMIGATLLGGGKSGFESALAATFVAVLVALLVVRAVPLPLWTRRSNDTRPPASV